MANKVYSVDWFQYYAINAQHKQLHRNTYFQGAENPETRKPFLYEVTEGQESHSIFRESYTIRCDKKQLVHIFMRPKMSAIAVDAVSIKVANRLLYKANWSWILHDIIDALGFKVKSITRIDLCCDFQQFDYDVWRDKEGNIDSSIAQSLPDNKRKELEAAGYTCSNLLPSDFIHRYLQDQETAAVETYIREGSNKFCAYGAKRVIADDGTKEINDSTAITISSAFEYIRWGSRESGVCTYLYNKSKELHDKSSKPWISERWQAAGLDESKGDVFRIEFSIKAKGLWLKKADQKQGMKPLKAKEMRQLSSSDIDTQLRLEETFAAYQYKYFTFRRVGKQKYRKDMKRIQLFTPSLQPSLLPTTYCSKPSVGVAERNAGLALQRLMWKAYALNPDKQVVLQKASDILLSLGTEIRQLNKADIQHNADWEKLYFTNTLNPEQRRIIDNYVKARIEPIDRLLNDPNVQRSMDEAEVFLNEAINQMLFFGTKEGKRLLDSQYCNEVDEASYFCPY